jgi:hypothetical protein
MSDQEPSFSRRFAHPDRKVLGAFAACLALVVSAAVAMGASPAPSSAGASASNAPAASARPHPEGSGKPNGGPFKLKVGRGLDGFAGGGIGLGRGGVEITAIDGTQVSLRTIDGWTRTIEVTSSTQVTKGGDTIATSDLQVGDTIRFRQKRNADGTFTVTRIAVVLPTVGGTVTGKTGSTITIQQRDGTSVTIHVNGSTQFRVEGVDGAAALKDVATGMKILAQGEKRSDGSLDASRVLAGTGRKLRGDHDGKKGAPDTNPNASPEASGNPG